MSKRKELLVPGTKVKHFKGKHYMVLCLAKHTEDKTVLVVYQALFGTRFIHARPIDLFLSKVDKRKYPGTSQEYRFELLESSVKK